MPGLLRADSRAWLTDPVESGAAAGFGVYLHIPFCHHRCGYCDFATAAVGQQAPEDNAMLFDRYVAALLTDLRRQIAYRSAVEGRADWPTVTSVFIGGGTPTLVGGPRLGQVLRALFEELDVAADAEITVECNPETATDELFATLAAAGANRVSMGAQSFAPHVLRTLERGHTAIRPIQAVAQARAGGIAKVSLDLIFGTPGETDEDWRQTVEQAVAAGVDHLSAYALTIHDNTAFGRAVGQGAMTNVDDDVQRERFDIGRDILTSAGFEHYEVSNFALGPDQRSRHNLLYWRHGDYLGVGVGAHAHLGGRRSWTTRSTQRYLEAVEAGQSPETGREQLTDDERAQERLLLGLRVREGLHPNDVPPLDPMALEDAMTIGLIETACGRIRCTDQGWFLLDEAVARLI